MMKMFLLAAAGSGIGGAARYGISRLLEDSSGTGFPKSTFWINIAGSFLIGLLWVLAEKNRSLSPAAAVFLMSGICGGFTTFSAFSLDNIRLIQAGQYATAGIYAIGSVLAGMTALWGGALLMKAIS